MRHAYIRKPLPTSAPEQAPVKTGNYSPAAAAMAITLVGAKVYETGKHLNEECAQRAGENPIIF